MTFTSGGGGGGGGENEMVWDVEGGGVRECSGCSIYI